MLNILKQVEDTLEKVSVQGEENWSRMKLAKQTLRELRTALERELAKKQAGQKEEEAAENGTSEDAIRQRKSEADAGTV